MDDRYAEIEARTVLHPLGPDNVALPFLSPEDLAVFKPSFGREKDLGGPAVDRILGARP